MEACGSERVERCDVVESTVEITSILTSAPETILASTSNPRHRTTNVLDLRLRQAPCLKLRRDRSATMMPSKTNPPNPPKRAKGVGSGADRIFSGSTQGNHPA